MSSHKPYHTTRFDDIKISKGLATLPYEADAIIFDKGMATVARSLVVEFHGNEVLQSFTIPDGFKCDGASTPMGAKKARVKPAGVVHDYMYRTVEVRVTRSQADAIFRAVLRSPHVGFGRFRSYWWWLAVRIFGRRYWSKR